MYLTSHLPTPALLNLIRTYSVANRKLTDGNYKWLTRHRKTRVFVRDNYTCQICGDRATKVEEVRHKSRKKTGAYQQVRFRYFTQRGNLLTEDHVLPKSLGGPDTISNLRTLCSECNHFLSSDVGYNGWVDKADLQWYIDQGFWFRAACSSAPFRKAKRGGRQWEKLTREAELAKNALGINRTLSKADKFVIYTVIGECA